jgi:hypothetical protein
MSEAVEYDEYIRQGTRRSMFEALDRAPDRSLHLLTALRAGRVNGFWYYGECACLIGILSGSNQRNIDAQIARVNAVTCGLRTVHGGYTDTPPEIIPAEQLFLTIRPGDTPANNKYSRYAEECVMDWLRYRAKSGPEEAGLECGFLEGKDDDAN